MQLTSTSLLMQQMAPAKQVKVMQEFQKQSSQLDMTVRLKIFPSIALQKHLI